MFFIVSSDDVVGGMVFAMLSNRSKISVPIAAYTFSCSLVFWLSDVA